MIVGAFLGALGVAGLVVALLNAHLRLLGIGAALVLLLLAMSLLSNAARIAHQLPTLVGKSVHIEAWGKPLEPTVTLQVHSVRAIGAGLHIYLRSPLADSLRDLKIAQPSGARLSDTQLTIEKAAYISLAGHRLERRAPHPALHLSWPVA